MAAKVRKNYWGLESGALLPRYMARATEKKQPRVAQVAVQMDKPKKSKSVVRVFESENDEAFRILVAPLAGDDLEKDTALRATVEARVRDAMGTLISTLERLEATEAEIDFSGPADLLESVALGLEMALYRFRRVLNSEAPRFSIRIKNRGKAVVPKALAGGVELGHAINVARHLVNLPPNLLNPKTYAEFVDGFLGGEKGLKAEIWDLKRLKREGMNLHIGVGKGASRHPRLVHIRYRGAGKKPPIALVGKGITFDSGGLDIKPSSGMRLMKKDMGGSAAVVGSLLWAARTKAKVNIDAYLALAENSVSSRSFRPSDVIRARNGLNVEIHNTDAEGRLVLADAMDVAITQKDKPRCLIDVATLTGAIKVALGAQLAGLFANDKKLLASLHKAGQESGDLNWPMPLYQKYRTQLNSNFADMVNAADGFGGAITAALFLEKFAGEIPWAHLDIYAWKDAIDGAWLEPGGSGQGVACLAEWLQSAT